MSSACLWGCPGGHSAFHHQACAQPTLYEAPSCPPQGVLGLPGVLWAVPAAAFTPVSLPSSARLPAYFQKRALVALPGFRSAGFFPRSDFTWSNIWVEKGALIVLLRLQEDKLLCIFSPCLQEPVTVSSHVVTISSLTPATSYNCSVTTFSHNSPSIPTFIAVSTMGKQHFCAFFFLLQLQHLFLLDF